MSEASEPDQRYVEMQLLAVRCARGEAQAWRALVTGWERPLLYYLRRLLPTEEDARDVLQETWLAAVRQVRQLRDGGLLSVWLFRIARNCAVSRLRRLRQIESLEALDAGEPPSAPNVPAAPAFDADDVAAVHAALLRLSLAHRDVLTLHYLGQLSLRQITETTGLSEGTIKSRLFYAKRALRSAMEKNHE